MKKVYLAIIVSAIVIVILLLFQKCQTTPQEEENDFVEETATQLEESEDEFGYRDAFIKANTNFTCQILAGNIDPTNKKESREALNLAYEEQGFPVNEDQEIIKLLDAYETDEEIIAIIKLRVQECK